MRAELTRDRDVPALVGLGAGLVMQLSLLWDFSWHTTIGRDTFWSPPHLGLYLGGAVPGCAGALVALWTSFRAPPIVRAGAVRIFGLHAPFGTWVALWGSAAMLTAGSFDLWWHSAYGLDLTIGSPPHIGLAIGIGAIQLGTWMLIAGGQNRVANPPRRFAMMHGLAAGLVVLMVAMFELEQTARTYMHATPFYLLVCATYPLLFVAARASRLPWPATTVAAVYTGFRLLVTWLLPLFPGSPRLGPIYFSPDHMVPPDFPLLLLPAAIGVDALWSRIERCRLTVQAVVGGGVFFALFVAAQWPFAEFLMSERANNWFFAGRNFRYFLSPQSYTANGVFFPWEQLGDQGRWVRLPAALIVAMASARLGLVWRDWLLRIQR